MGRLLPLLLPLVLAACGFSGPPRHAQTTYILQASEVPPAVTAPLWHGTLLVRDMEAPAFYENAALAFSREPGTRGHYQYAHLTDPPAIAMTSLITHRLDRSGLFQDVTALGQGVTGNWQLNLTLIDLYHDASSPPGSVHLAYEAELVRRDLAQAVARRHVEAVAAATTYDATGAAAAANRAIDTSLVQLTEWLQQQATRAPPAKPAEAR